MQSDKLNLIRAGGLKDPNEPESRRGFNMGRVDDKIFIWNGYSIFNRPKIHRDSENHKMYIYDITQKSWSSVDTHGDSIVSCSGSGVCSLDFKIYVFGGFSDFKFFNTLGSFDTKNLEWLEIKGKGQIPQPRDKISPFIHENHIYIFGGWSFSILGLQPGAAFHQDLSGWGAGWNNEFHKYDTTTNHWSYVQTIGRVPEPRAATSFIKIDSTRALLFGGRTRSSRTNDLYMFHLTTNTWEFFIVPMTPGTPWPCERSLFSAHLVSDPRAPNPQVLGFWGMDKNSNLINDYWLFDCLTLKWHSIGHSVLDRTQPRLWGSSCSFFDCKRGTTQIYVFGGCIGSLLGPDHMKSEDQLGIIHFEYGLKRLEMMCKECIISNFTLFSEVLSQSLPPNLVLSLCALLKQKTPID